MVSKAEVAWAAGFYEGEGYLTKTSPPRVQIAQCNIEPLEKLQSLFGGSIYGPEMPKGARQPVFRWVLGDHASSKSFIYAIFPWLSDKKQKDTLDKIDRYADVVLVRQSNCRNGHNKDKVGFYILKGGHQRCKACHKETRERNRI